MRSDIKMVGSTTDDLHAKKNVVKEKHNANTEEALLKEMIGP